MTNYADLAYTAAENEEIIKEAKASFKIVRKVKHPKGYYQIFVA